MSSEHAPAAQTRRNRILVVDDEPLVTLLMAETLALVGHEVDTAKNGREALEKVSACAYDVILSVDQRHPNLCRRIAFVSGTTEPVEYAGFLEETGVPVLLKPFAIDDLQRLVQRLLQANP